MKNLQILIFLVFAMILVGCASNGFLMAKPEVTIYGKTYPPKGEKKHIDIFQTKLPDRAYIEVAKISCGDTEVFLEFETNHA